MHPSVFSIIPFNLIFLMIWLSEVDLLHLGLHYSIFLVIITMIFVKLVDGEVQQD